MLKKPHHRQADPQPTRQPALDHPGDPSRDPKAAMGPSGERSKLLSEATLRRFTARRYQRQREVVVPSEVKRERAESGRGCEVCGWILRPGDWRSLHAHHVIPVSCGGSDRRENLMVVCPNHHAAAHRCGRRRKAGYDGPRTREDLLRAIVRLEAWSRQ